jgi:hypothetical protein
VRYKDNWEETQRRFDDWWSHKLTGRAIVMVTAPRDKPAEDIPAPPDPPDLLARWTDAQYRAIHARRGAACTFHGGEAVPQFWPNLGPGIAATYVGSTPTFHEGTVWFGPLPHQGLDDIDRYLVYDPHNKWWQLTRRLTQAALEKAQGELIVGLTDLGGIHDILASLRGTSALLTDFIDSPQAVQRLARKITLLWHRYYDELRALMLQAGQTTTCAWMGLWCRQTWYPLQCDYSAMISPAMFHDHVLPELVEQCRRLDHSVYHWDGPGEIPHLQHLLSIDRLDAIQWTSGDGNPGLDADVWMPYYRRITHAGKGLVLLGMPAGSIRRVCSKLPQEQLAITTWCATEREARDLIASLG